jgi:hypothetical protein
VGDRERAVWLLRQLEVALVRVGGAELVGDAWSEAEWFAALYHPWDGDGDESLARTCARIEILTRRLDMAAATHCEPV